MARSATGPRPFLVAAAGLVAGAVASAGLAAAGWPQRHPASPPPAPETAVAASRFLDAWERSRTGTWVVDARFERVTATGRRLDAQVHMAQRPPDRLVTGLGSIDGRVGGERLACAAGDDGVLGCRRGGPAPPYADEVGDIMRVLATYVRGPAAFYAVREEGDCFALRLRIRVLSPPYGERARFCFDPATGAPVRSEIVRKEGVDRTVAVTVRPRPSGDDLDPEKWNGGGRG